MCFRRYHEVFEILERLASPQDPGNVDEKGETKSLSVDDKMRMMLVVLHGNMGDYNNTSLLRLASELSLIRVGVIGLKFMTYWFPLSSLSDDNTISFTSTIAMHLLALDGQDSLPSEHHRPGGCLELAEEMMDGVKAKVERNFGLKNYSEAIYHRVLCEIHKQRKDYTRVCKHAMLHLKNRPQQISEEHDLKLAEDLCMATLLSPNVFSFTDLLQQEDILKTISPGSKYYDENDGNVWRDLVVICNNGDYDMYKLFLQKYAGNEGGSSKLEQLGLTPGYLSLIESKLRSFALLESAFKKSERLFTFEEVSNICRIPQEEVELFILSLMRRGLLSGKIDAVDNVVTFHKLQPRVLDADKILNMSQQFLLWSNKMDAAVKQMRDLSPTVQATLNVL
ncbi:putative 26S proteasome subunit [Gregarina niphandrodes]|uniref:26S proteasome subunit n=1 Tax=Gregarina niphandrodes TaxID=110365 RepID=A0A023B2Z6_GRENI|nr:putative 26S proteasome subunit [Gregarina niphandrodes]EZG53812.1 putative 26S proteasome subunit [Gregarina niphandrodes]|eukprot:XP_011131855.1 putative 26S proteasome subunit [Gregarina niphandrodes]